MMKSSKGIQWKSIVLTLLVVLLITVTSCTKSPDNNTNNSDDKVTDKGNSNNGKEENADTSQLMSGDEAQQLIKDEDEFFLEGDIICQQLARYSGQYVEDGRDELIDNVAAILVKNKSKQYLDLCTLQYDIDGKTAIFVVTGLPAGKSAWVMEKSKLAINENATFTYQGSTTSFRNEAFASSDKLSILSSGNTLNVTNISEETLENVCVYYKVLHTDGNYLGGITYMVNFGTLKPNDSVDKVAGHYAEGSSEIVRIGWTSAN